jgi:hypothetical protein
MSRKRFEPTREQRGLVRALAGIGMRQEQIAGLVVNPEGGRPISVPTLRQAFRNELTTGRANVIARGVVRLLQLVDSRNERVALGATTFLLKTQGGFKETGALEVSGPEGAPLQMQDVKAMTKEEKAAAIAHALVMHFRRRPLPPELAVDGSQEAATAATTPPAGAAALAGPGEPLGPAPEPDDKRQAGPRRREPPAWVGKFMPGEPRGGR